MLSHPGKNRVNINSPFGPSATQPGSGGRNPSLDSFVEAKRRGDLEKMRHSVNEWHFVVYQLERETTGLFSHLISSQGFSGVIWDLLINRLFNGVGISWGYEDGFWGKPPPLLSLILSGVLILGKNGECYPGPFFPSLVDPKEIQKAKLQEFREFREFR